MKNTLVYYCAVFLPILAFIFFSNRYVLSTEAKVLFFFSYLLVYRTYTDAMRLIDKNVLPKKDFWKILLPGSHIKYFKELYLP